MPHCAVISLQAQTWRPVSATWLEDMMVSTTAICGVKSTLWTFSSVASKRKALWIPRLVLHGLVWRFLFLWTMIIKFFSASFLCPSLPSSPHSSQSSPTHSSIFSFFYLLNLHLLIILYMSNFPGICQYIFCLKLKLCFCHPTGWKGVQKSDLRSWRLCGWNGHVGNIPWSSTMSGSFLSM